MVLEGFRTSFLVEEGTSQRRTVLEVGVRARLQIIIIIEEDLEKDLQEVLVEALVQHRSEEEVNLHQEELHPDQDWNLQQLDQLLDLLSTLLPL